MPEVRHVSLFFVCALAQWCPLVPATVPSESVSLLQSGSLLQRGKVAAAADKAAVEGGVAMTVKAHVQASAEQESVKKTQKKAPDIEKPPAGSISQLLDMSIRANEKSDGHFLTNTELGPINSIACLQAKQANPAVVCKDGEALVSDGSRWSGQLTAGNFPSYKDPVCNSNGEFLCDPDKMLSNDSRVLISQELHRLRESTPVTCGRLLNDKVDREHYQPFYLGVVVLKDWPVSQSSPEALQTLGQIIAAGWNMNELYVGGTQPYLRCPNSGVLLVLPSNNQVYLSTESCEFICSAQGGPEVTTAALAGLRGKDAAASAALAGLQTAYNFLQHTSSSSLSADGQQAPPAQGLQGAFAAASPTNVGMGYTNMLQRAVWAMALIACLFSLGIALFVLVVAPGAIARARKR